MIQNSEHFTGSFTTTKFDLSILQNIGNRQEQQDSIGCDVQETFGMVVICDGMGGHKGGMIAGKTSVGMFLERYYKEPLLFENREQAQKTIYEIDEKVSGLTDENGNVLRCGSTLVAAELKNSELRWISVGDSHLYLFRNGKLNLITEEHILQKDLERKYRDGVISAQKYNRESKARGEALTSFIGIGSISDMDLCPAPIPVFSEDRILLASDGLYKFLPTETIEVILMNFSNPTDALSVLETKVLKKNRAENKNGDNITMALFRIF